MKLAGSFCGTLRYCRHCQQRAAKPSRPPFMPFHQHSLASSTAVLSAGLWPPSGPTWTRPKRKDR